MPVVNLTIKADADITAAKSAIDSLQAQWSKFGTSSKLGDKINKEFANFGKAYETYMSKIGSNMKTKADFSATTKSLDIMKSSLENILRTSEKLGATDPLKSFANDSKIKNITKEIENVQNKIQNLKFDPKQLNNIFGQISGNIGKKNTKIPGLIAEIQQANNAGNYEQTAAGLEKLQHNLLLSKARNEELAASYEKTARSADKTASEQQRASQKAQEYSEKAKNLSTILNQLTSLNPKELSTLTAELDKLFNARAERGQQLAHSFQDFTNKVQQSKTQVEQLTSSLHKIHGEEFNMARQVEMIDRQIQSYFGLSQILRKVMNIGRQAMQTVKDLDASMTATAVVTNFDVGDMWEKLPQYTAAANELGSTIKDVYDATTLYYQQGLNSSQAMGIATETLKMARIGGIEAAEATDMMTAALRGFNMQINELSAQRINDVYSKLAAMSASNTKELGTAMERTASIANSAGMDFGNTSAFLAQMIETTREPAENIGTAMKTIVARFQEMKKSPQDLIDVDGEMMDVNRVDKALKSVGITLMENNEKFRNLDEVFLEISSKWDGLNMAQQRYIATMAAGSRQQSRFLALMSDHERLMELVDGATNSAGASQQQFDKTLESFSAKANKLKNAWDQFTMGLLNDKLLKGAVDFLTGTFTVINKIINGLSAATGPFKDFTKTILTFGAVLGSLSLARKGLNTGVEGIFNWWSGKTSMTQMFGNIKNVATQGRLSGTTYVKNAAAAVSKDTSLQKAIQAQWQQKGLDTLRNKKNYQIFKNEEGESATVKGQIEALKSGALKASSENLASVRGGITQSLFSNNNFISGLGSTAVQDGNQLINTYMTALKQQIEAQATGKGAKEAMLAMKKARGDIGKAAYKGAIESGSTKEAAHEAAAKAVKNAENNLAQIPTAKVDQFTEGVSKANNGLMQLGMLLQGTPLAPFGKILTMVSMAASAFAGIMTGLVGVLADTAAASLIASGSLTTSTGATVTDAMWTELDAAAKWKLIAANNALGASFLSLLGAIAPIALAIGALILAYNVFTYQSKQLETLHDRAAAANDAFTSIKQEVSELKDKLKTLNEYDDAFKELVVGTTEFNSKLMESNELVSELIKKYPELADEGHVTTDKNGRMNIDQAGREMIQQKMTERQSQAQALDILATADYKKLLAEQEARKGKDYQEAYKAEHKGAMAAQPRYRSMVIQRNKAEMKARGEDTTEAVLTKAADKATVKYKESQKAAITAMIGSQKDLINADAVASVINENYSNLEKSIKADKTDKEKAETYAKQYGYEHISGNKFKNSSGEEVEVDKKIWSDETTNKRIKANEQIVNSAQIVDSTLNHLNGSIGNVFDDLEIESSSLVSDILSNNINTDQDDLKKILEQEDFTELLNSLSAKEREALKQAGIDDLGAALQERGRAILDAQKQQDIDLGVMFSKAAGVNADEFAKNGDKYKATIDGVTQQLNSLTSEEKAFLNETGQALEENFGTANMTKFMNVFRNGTQDTRNKLTEISKDVDWTSSISSLGAITKMTKSANGDIKQLGQEMRTSAEGSKLLAFSMQELFAAEDFQKVTEDMDSFVDSSGRLDAAGIEEMAEKSGTLSELLETDAISAGGLAAALNATAIDGVADITSLNDSVLRLLDSFTQLDSVMSEAHQIVENFDPGIDTGEGDDFIKDAVEKVNEYVNNGEWGNEQLENYTKLFVGEKRWGDQLAKNNGDLKATVKHFKPLINSFEKGFVGAWKNIGKGVDAYGNKIDSTQLKSKKLQQISASINSEGGVHLEVGKATTKDVTSWIQQMYKVNSDTAKLMLTDFVDHSEKMRKTLEANDFAAGVKSGDFFKSNLITNEKGEQTVTLSKTNLDVLAAGSGKTAKEIDTVIRNAAKEQGVKYQTLQNQYAKGERKGQLIDDYNLLNKRLSLITEGKTEKESVDNFAWLKQFTTGNQVNLNNALDYGNQVGLDTSQTQGMLYEAYKALTEEGREFEYNDQTIKPDKINSYSDFLDAITKAEENKNWVGVGEAIAKGYIDYLAQKKKEEQKEKETEEGEKWSDNPQSRALTYETQPSSPRILQLNQELGGLATDSSMDIGERAATIAQVSKELKLQKKELNDVNDGFIQLNFTDLSQLNNKQLDNTFKKLKITGEKAKSAKKDISNFNALTKDQKIIAIRTDISGTEKVTKLMDPILEKFGGKNEVKKALIIEAAARMAEGKDKEASELLGQAGIEGKDKKVVKKQIDFAVNAGIANPKEVQDSLNQQVDKSLTKGGNSKKANIKKKVEIQYNEKGKKPKTKSTITSNIKVGKDEATNKINSLQKSGKKDVPFNLKANPDAAKKVIDSVHAKARESQSFNVSANPSGTWSKDFTVNVKVKKTKDKNKDPGEATGVRQMGSIPKLPAFQSLASGKHTKKLGTAQIGPRDHGGPTLTGELGYEVVWLPKKGESMIVGANGPQMVDLPGDAVVWNHEQSKKILKQKSIPTGSNAKGTINAGSAGGADAYSDGGNQVINKKVEKSGTVKGGKQPKDKTKKTEILIFKFAKFVDSWKKITNWWENISRKADGIERIANQNQKKFESVLTRIDGTATEALDSLKTYTKSLETTIKVNNSIIQTYAKKLEQLDKQGANTSKQQKALRNANKAEALLAKRQAQYDVAKKTSSKKDDKKAKRNLDKAKKAANKARNKKAIKNRGGIERVEWDQAVQVKTRVKKGKKKGKVKKQTTKVKRGLNVDYSKLISYDKETGTYVLDQKKVNALAKKVGGKKGSGKAAKAIKEKGNKLIDEYTQRKNQGEDRKKAAEEAINEANKKIIDTFYGWENALNKVYATSKKIALVEAKISKYQSKFSYYETIFNKLKVAINGINISGFSYNLAKMKENNQASIDAYKDIATFQDRQIDYYNEQVKVKTRLGSEKNFTYYNSKGEKVRVSEKEAYKDLKKKNKNNKSFDGFSDAEKALYAKGYALEKGILKKDEKSGAWTVDVSTIEKLRNSGLNINLVNEIQKLADEVSEAQTNVQNSSAAYFDALNNAEQAEQNWEDTLKDITEAVYGWENSLTKIAQLTEQIENAERRTNILKSAREYYQTRYQAGYGNVPYNDINKTYQAELQSRIYDLKHTSNLLTQQKATLDRTLANTDLSNELNALKKELNNTTDASKKEVIEQKIEDTQEDLRVRELAKRYLAITKHDNGTVSVNYLTEQIEADKNAGDLTKETFEKIEAYAQDLIKQSQDIQDSVDNYTQDATEFYKELIELQKALSERAQELREAYGKQQQEIIDKIKALYSALDNAFKNLIDTVKNKLDERRQAEDNIKTERDIAQKQQRLAVLRANTSGGNQVEIAKLQKEVDEAQQNYGRTLEDQLLSQLQKQNDEASKQRQQQIDLLQAQRDIAAKTGADAAEINKWLSNPDRYKSNIELLLQKTASWDSLTDAEKASVLNDIQQKITDIASLPLLIQDMKNSIGTIETNGTTANVNTNTNNTISTVNNAERKEEQSVAAQQAQNKADDAARKKAEEEAARKKAEEEAAKKRAEEEAAKKRAEEEAARRKKEAEQNYKDTLKAVKNKKPKDLTKGDVNQLFTAGKAAGKNKKEVITDLLAGNKFSWSNSMHAIINADGIHRYNLVKTWPNSTYLKNALEDYLSNEPDTIREIKKSSTYKNTKTLDQYKLGGLADFTGPAWLDGTTSKPELVLNATDTKNFIQLKDILSRAFTSGNFEGSTSTDTIMYEININVDKITKDYDVDRVAERVKKIIVKDAGYRNVTQVSRMR